MQFSVLVSIWVICSAALVTGQTPAMAQAAAPDEATFHKIIKDQMKAFADADANAAFSYETGALQQRFQTPAVFMNAIKYGYRPIFHPKDVIFGLSRTTGTGTIQEVYITGPGGNTWLALYNFEQQEDDSWRISGCYLTKSPGFTT